MEKQIIGRGILAGALAGVLAFIWAKVLIEPIIGRAIDFENSAGAAHEAAEHRHGAGGHSHGGGESAEVFTRGVQSNIGMGLGVLIFSVAMGALLAVVFCVLYGRANLSARALAALTAGGMLVSLWIVPALKYPPNPPATSLDGDHQAADPALPAAGGAVGGVVRRFGAARTSVDAEAGGVECHPDRRRGLRGVDGRGLPDPAGHPRDPVDVPGRRPLPSSGCIRWAPRW